MQPVARNKSIRRNSNPRSTSHSPGRHECIWPEPIKLPAQADPSKDEKVREYDALTDAGLLIRGSAEKKRFLVGSKQVNSYDLSDKGHPAWTPDPKQPGYGNFCFGHFNVTAINNATPNDPSNPTQYTVNYRYEVEGIPDWARTPESMRTFRKIAADTSIQSATATLVKRANGVPNPRNNRWESRSPRDRPEVTPIFG